MTFNNSPPFMTSNNSPPSMTSNNSSMSSSSNAVHSTIDINELRQDMLFAPTDIDKHIEDNKQSLVHVTNVVKQYSHESILLSDKLDVIIREHKIIEDTYHANIILQNTLLNSERNKLITKIIHETSSYNTFVNLKLSSNERTLLIEKTQNELNQINEVLKALNYN